MNNSLLSIIMPVYNSEKYLTDTLNSLLSQDYTEIEVICVNDCSTDGSLDILREFEQKDSRIKCISLKENIGAGKARNEGIKCCVGAYIAFLDADDQVLPHIYKEAVSLIEKSGAEQVVWGAVEEHFDDKDKLIKSVPILPKAVISENKKEVARTVLRLEEQTLFGYLWNSVYKANIIKANGIRMNDYLFYEDYFFNLDFIKHSDSIAVIDSIGYRYFKRANSSITHSFSKDYYALSYKRVESFYEYCKQCGILDCNAINVLANKLLRYSLSALSRNNNPLSKLSFKARREWVCENLFSRELYTALLSGKINTNPVFRLLKFAINTKSHLLCLLLGKAVYILRK
ncbi:MAG: glycosyltransferase [Acutalibacteraceae bacterium]|nr:glycosyltransferase [Acutalibacteraceae bacterium]